MQLCRFHANSIYLLETAKHGCGSKSTIRHWIQVLEQLTSNNYDITGVKIGFLWLSFGTWTCSYDIIFLILFISNSSSVRQRVFQSTNICRVSSRREYRSRLSKAQDFSTFYSTSLMWLHVLLTIRLWFLRPPATENIPWYRFFLKNIYSVKKFLLLWKPKIHPCVRRRTTWDFITSQFNPLYFSKTFLNIVLPLASVF
jgi:hypothetical protein